MTKMPTLCLKCRALYCYFCLDEFMFNILPRFFMPASVDDKCAETVTGSFRVNSTNGSQVSVSNIAQKIPKITLVSIMNACKILGCNSEYFWRYSLSNFLFCIAFLPSRLKC